MQNLHMILMANSSTLNLSRLNDCHLLHMLLSIQICTWEEYINYKFVVFFYFFTATHFQIKSLNNNKYKTSHKNFKDNFQSHSRVIEIALKIIILLIVLQIFLQVLLKFQEQFEMNMDLVWIINKPLFQRIHLVMMISHWTQGLSLSMNNKKKKVQEEMKFLIPLKIWI